MNNNPDTTSTEKKLTRRRFFKLAAAAFIGTGLAALRYDQTAPEPPTPPPVPDTPPQDNIPQLEKELPPPPEFLFFKSAAEADQYLMDEEKQAGFDRATMSHEQMRAHRAELRHHTERTIRFVISHNKFYELKNQGKDPQQLIQKQVDKVNEIYEKAGVPITYTLQTTLVVDWSVQSTEIHHQHGDGVTVGNQGKLHYSWTDDTLWVMADDQLQEGADQRIMFVFNPDENDVDHGYVHEIVHHTGIHDLYRSRGYFKEGPLWCVRPYDRDLMCKQETLELTPASTLGITKFLEIPYYGPQHDEPLYLTDTENRLTESFAEAWYNLNFVKPSGENLQSLVKKHSIVQSKDADGWFIAENAPMSQSGSSWAITEHTLVSSKYSLFDIGQIKLPVERLHYIYSNVYKSENNGVVPIKITLLVDPQTFVPDKTMSIEIVPVGMETQIQQQYFDKQVIAYSPIANTGTFTVWLNGRISNETDEEIDQDH